MTQKIAIALILIGFSVWISLLGMNEFTLTESIFDANIKPEHQAVLKPELAKMFDKKHSNVFSFSTGIKAAINKLNDAFDTQKKWDKKIYDKYELTLSKASSKGYIIDNQWIIFLFGFGLIIIGGLIFIFSNNKISSSDMNNDVFKNPATSRKWLGILIGTFLIFFYVVLYFFPEYLTNWILLVEPISKALNGGSASQWFLYGLLYTIAILVMGVRMLRKYKHSNYHIIRTLNIIFFQTCIAFILPEIMTRLNLPAADLKNIWPLDYSFFFDYRIDEKIKAGSFGLFLLGWGIALFLIGVPAMTYLFGKRWYCSWVCGCGGLAETLGDPWRQLSDKSLKAWKIEKYSIYLVLLFAVFMTAGVLYSYFTKSYNLLGFIPTESLKSWYGFYIGAIFSGVVGTGFYPIMGNRVWCRFGCPLAAYLGIIQKFKSRFRITTNGGQCISCGNCSAYCEMGIDVRWYAQRGQDVVRASCVGCGVCSSVCPRGVLKLENANETTRNTEPMPIIIGNGLVKMINVD